MDVQNMLTELGPTVAGMLLLAMVFAKILRSRDAVIKDIAEEGHKLQRESNQIIGGCTKVLERLNGK